MQITLQETELKEAVRDFIGKAGISQAVGEIDFTATRGGGSSGIVTGVEILSIASDVEPRQTASVSNISDTAEVTPKEDTAEVLEADDVAEDEGGEKKSLFN